LTTQKLHEQKNHKKLQSQQPSSGLTSLLAGMREADKVNGSFRICNVDPEAGLVFEVTMMDTVLEIFDTEEQVLQTPVRSLASS